MFGPGGIIKFLLVTIFIYSSSLVASQNCNVLSYDKDLPKSILEVLEGRGYKIYYFVLNEFSKESLTSSYKLRYSEQPKSILGTSTIHKWNFSIKFEGRKQKIITQDENENKVIEFFINNLENCV